MRDRLAALDSSEAPSRLIGSPPRGPGVWPVAYSRRCPTLQQGEVVLDAYEVMPSDEATPDGGWRQMSAADETIWREVERWEAPPAPSSRPEASSSAPEAQDEEAAPAPLDEAQRARLGSLKVAELRALLEGGGIEVAGKKATKAALLQQIEAAVASGAVPPHPPRERGVLQRGR